MQADKSALTHELGIQLRDLRLLDPQLAHSYPSAILCREKALVVNLEHIKCIITTDQVSSITWGRVTKQLCKASRSWLPMAVCSQPQSAASHHFTRGLGDVSAMAQTPGTDWDQPLLGSSRLQGSLLWILAELKWKPRCPYAAPVSRTAAAYDKFSI